MKNRLFRLCAVGLLLLISAGCAHQIVVMPSHGLLTSSSAKLPVDVGLYMADSFKNYQHSAGKMGDTWQYTNMGQASAALFRYGLEQRFRSVVVLPRRLTNLASAGVTIMVEPEISSFTFDLPLFKFQIYPATIRFKLSAVGANGEVFYSNVVSGVGDSNGSPGFDFAANPARSATKAIEVGVIAALDELVNSPGLRKLLASPTLNPAAKTL